MLALRFTLITLISIFLGGCMPKAQMNKPVPLVVVHFTVPAANASCTAQETYWRCHYQPTTATACLQNRSGVTLCLPPPNPKADKRELALRMHILTNLKVDEVPQFRNGTCLTLGGLYVTQCITPPPDNRVAARSANCQEGTADNPQPPATPPTNNPIIPGNTCP